MTKIILLLISTTALAFLIFFTTRPQKINLVEAQTSLSTYLLKAEASQKMIVYEITSVEKIKRVEALPFLWNLISSSNVDVEMLVPVRYSYYVDFTEGFKIEKTSTGYKITAPRLQSYAPAADISGISFRVKEAPYFYNIQKIEDQISSQLTEYLLKRSEDLKSKYSTEARQSVEQLVRNWILNSGEYKSLSDSKIDIIFRSEAESALQ